MHTPDMHVNVIYSTISETQDSQLSKHKILNVIYSTFQHSNTSDPTHTTVRLQNVLGKFLQVILHV